MRILATLFICLWMCYLPASNDESVQYLEFIRKEYPELLRHYDGSDLSSHTLRYIKIAGDLKQLYSSLSQMHILDIGGNGELGKILEELGGFASYTIVNDSTIKDMSVQDYDLVISDEAFCTCSPEMKKYYLTTVFPSIANGYLIIGLPSMEKVISTLRKNGKQGKVEAEKPFVNPDRVMLTWKNVDKTKSLSKKYQPPKLHSSSAHQKKSAITYSFSGGRLGDNLLAYLHAKWIAYKYDLPFLYKPFDYSDQFKLDEMDHRYNESRFSFQNVISIQDEKQIKKRNPSSLYVVPYFPECRLEYEMLDLYYLPYFKVDWKDPDFHAEVVRCLTPKKRIRTPKLPKDCITVAVHVRRGGGVDNYSHESRVRPLKFPPDSYYIEQLKRISKIFKNEKLYVYIFTDDQNPQSIVDHYSQALNNPRAEFDCRERHNGPSSNVLEDFFFLTRFDCLIRCESNFSVVASKLGNYKVMINPTHCFYTEDKQVVVDQVEIEFN